MNTNDKLAAFGKVDSIDFAIYLNQKARELGKEPNVTKIQKWLYICYGLYFAAYNEQLLTERPKAWDYGPVFPRVHKKQLKNKGSLNNVKLSMLEEELKKYNDVIEGTLRVFGDWTASELVNWTHEKGTAWDKTYNLLEAKYAPMDNYDIMLDFKKVLSNES
ncbi:MAG: DUF4065 domain-containing protein [Spirochaetaceae bacterium]|nr:DUF4065 domain-containing protein [Spirochaetaceae bacterium]